MKMKSCRPYLLSANLEGKKACPWNCRPYLLSADLEGERLTPVPGAVHLLSVSEGKDVVADDSLARPKYEQNIN
jgi:hypothetical protein